MNKRMFRILFKLQSSQPWLNDCEDALEKLLYSDCSADVHRNLMIELINRFEYLSNEKYSSILGDLAEDIGTDPDLSDQSTQIVAMSADDKADSSQYVLYGLKPFLEKMDWRSYKQVNTFGHAYRTYKKSNNYKNVVLVDEFVGTGKTVLSRVKQIKRDFQDNGVIDFLIKVKVLVATKRGQDNIQSEGIEISPRITLKRGISDYYPPEVVDRMIKFMREMEELLSDEYNGRSLPSLGYGQLESLYCRENGNTPNNVFPIFWWPFYQDGRLRNTLLTRAMGDA